MYVRFSSWLAPWSSHVRLPGFTSPGPFICCFLSGPYIISLFLSLMVCFKIVIQLCINTYIHTHTKQQLLWRKLCNGSLDWKLKNKQMRRTLCIFSYQTPPKLCNGELCVCVMTQKTKKAKKQTKGSWWNYNKKFKEIYFYFLFLKKKIIITIRNSFLSAKQNHKEEVMEENTCEGEEE